MMRMLAFYLSVPAHHPALPAMSLQVCRTILAAAVAFAAYILLMHWKLWPLAVAWALFSSFSLTIYLLWLLRSFRHSIHDDGGLAWIDPPEPPALKP